MRNQSKTFVWATATAIVGRTYLLGLLTGIVPMLPLRMVTTTIGIYEWQLRRSNLSQVLNTL